MIQETIRNGIKDAAKNRDAIRLNVLRGLVAAFTNELVAKRRKPDEILTDEEATAVIKRAVKQRKDSIEQFRAGGREDLVKDEEAELAIVETFMPQMMSAEEIEKIAREKISSMETVDKNKSGMIVGTIMKELKGKAEGTLVKEAVEKILGQYSGA